LKPDGKFQSFHASASVFSVLKAPAWDHTEIFDATGETKIEKSSGTFHLFEGTHCHGLRRYRQRKAGTEIMPGYGSKKVYVAKMPFVESRYYRVSSMRMRMRRQSYHNTIPIRSVPTVQYDRRIMHV
jgi:aminomethyltransferase